VDATVAEIAVATAAAAVVAVADAVDTKTPTSKFLAIRRRVQSTDAGGENAPVLAVKVW
jgi:hypothetical protein